MVAIRSVSSLSRMFSNPTSLPPAWSSGGGSGDVFPVWSGCVLALSGASWPVLAQVGHCWCTPLIAVSAPHPHHYPCCCSVLVLVTGPCHWPPSSFAHCSRHWL